MALRKVLLQGLRLKNKAVPGHGVGPHQWIHRAAAAARRLALHGCASRGGGCSESLRGWAACAGRPCPGARRRRGALPGGGP